jgi:hypothetical protein
LGDNDEGPYRLENCKFKLKSENLAEQIHFTTPYENTINKYGTEKALEIQKNNAKCRSIC